MAAAATAALSIIAYWYARDTPPTPVLECEQALPKGSTHTQALGKPEWRELFVNRNLLLLTVGYFTLNYFEYIFFDWIYYYFGEVRRLGRDMSAIYTTVLLLTMMVMMPLGGWLADRPIPRWGLHVSRRRVAVAGMTLSALLLYLGINITDTLAMVALLSLAASAEGPFWASAIDAGGRQAGAAGGLLNSVGNFGGLLAPTLTPTWLSVSGGPMASTLEASWYCCRRRISAWLVPPRLSNSFDLTWFPLYFSSPNRSPNTRMAHSEL